MVRSQLSDAWRLARETLLNKREDNNAKLNEKANPLYLEVNDLVMIVNRKTENKEKGKWRQPWIGPYRVSAVCGDSHITIRDGKKDVRVHLDFVKRAKAEHEDIPPELVMEKSLSQEEIVYFVIQSMWAKESSDGIPREE